MFRAVFGSCVLMLSIGAYAVECEQSELMKHYFIDFEDSRVLRQPESGSGGIEVDFSVNEDGSCKGLVQTGVANGLNNFDLTWIQFQGGDPSVRMAEIVDDPLDENNKVLETWISEGWIPGGPRGRVQLNMYDAQYSYKKLHYSVRVMIPESFRAVSSDNDITFQFFTLGELFNKPKWMRLGHAFRVQYGLEKIQSEGESDSGLRLRASGEARREWEDDKWRKEDNWEVVWFDSNKDFEIPVGEWITLDVMYIEGGEDEGVFSIKVARDGEEFEEVIGFATDGSPDYRQTYDINDPDPEGLRYFNPIKLYTNEIVLQELREKGIVARVLWDDYQLRPSSVVTTRCFVRCYQ